MLPQGEEFLMEDYGMNRKEERAYVKQERQAVIDKLRREIMCFSGYFFAFFRILIIVFIYIAVLFTIGIYVQEIEDINFLDGKYAGGKIISTARDVSDFWHLNYLTDEQYTNYKSAFNVLSQKTWRDEKISKEDINRYNIAVKAINLLNYDEKSLGTKGEIYIMGLRSAFKLKIYEEILHLKAVRISEENRIIFDALKAKTNDGSWEEMQEAYEALFKYADELIRGYMTA